MIRRKLIGLITAVPESNHVKRVLEGVFSQCEKYGYNVAVFAPLAHLSTIHRDYIKGELNIYELINFDLLDGVIVDSISLVENNDETIRSYIYNKIQKECKCPVVSLNLSFGEYPMVNSSDEPVFREIIEHMLDVHKLTNIYFLSGQKDYPIAEERIRVFKDVMAERGITVTPEQIFYGDFWYTSGVQLAERMISGEIPLPEAVICASDHMAIGMVNKLAENGIRIPEDVIVSGFEASQEAALNEISVTSFESNQVKTAAEAVDILRGKIEPTAEIIPYTGQKRTHLHAGMSCGCDPDFLHSARAFKDSFYYLFGNYEQKDWRDNVDIGLLMEGYVVEQLSATEMPQECLEKIYQNVFYIRPYANYYLCLKEDWLDPDKVIVSGYPEKMKTVLFTTPGENTGYYEDEKSEVFETKWMLPQMFEEHELPSVYYFSAVHFQEKMLGYSVLRRELREKQKLGSVYRNWLRNINNALEMIQAKNRIRILAIYDAMTGAYNRRGMDMMLEKMLAEAKEGDRLFVSVIDMDGLKYVNDRFGHAEGDFGIKLVCDAVMAILKPGEICVRAGGDEFYVLGVGRYEEAEIEQRKKNFYDCIWQADRTSCKPYTISASIGWALSPINKSMHIIDILNTADEDMYKNKIERKKTAKQS